MSETGRVNFYDQTPESAQEWALSLGEKKFRAQQLFKWIYRRGVVDFSLMTDISKSFRERLSEVLVLEQPRLISDLESEDGTRKFLFDVGEGDTVEAVVISSAERKTLCVSTQVGCNMGCRFCFTGKQKMKRRLRTSEIVGQFLTAQKALSVDQKITNIVYMGMGEPLDNPGAVFDSIKVFNSPWGLGLSKKRITISTSGLVDRIPLVTDSGARLAVSLNAVSDSVRTDIMPINKRWPLAELLEACREHCRRSKDKVTFEYVLLKGVTDSLEDARALARLAAQVPCKVNIIPFNEHPGSGFTRPDPVTIEMFQGELMRLGVHVLLRRTKGRDIYAACGQLTSAYKEHPGVMTAGAGI